MRVGVVEEALGVEDVARPPQGGRGLRAAHTGRYAPGPMSLALPRAGADCELSTSLEFMFEASRSPSPGRARIARAGSRRPCAKLTCRSPSPGRARFARCLLTPGTRGPNHRSPSPRRARIASCRPKTSPRPNAVARPPQGGSGLRGGSEADDVVDGIRRSPSPGQARIASCGCWRKRSLQVVARPPQGERGMRAVQSVLSIKRVASLALPRAGADCESMGLIVSIIWVMSLALPRAGADCETSLRSRRPSWSVARPHQGGRGLLSVRVPVEVEEQQSLALTRAGANGVLGSTLSAFSSSSRSPYPRAGADCEHVPPEPLRQRSQSLAHPRAGSDCE